MTSVRIETSGPAVELVLGEAGRSAYEGAVRRAIEGRWVRRLADRDPSLWSGDPAVQGAIAERLGWLDAPRTFAERTGSLELFGEEARANGFTAAVVAGMGGSSLTPLVLRETFGLRDGWLDVRVLDSTDPAAVAATVDDLDPLTTLFIVASKSGTTAEALAFQADAWERIGKALAARAHPRPATPGDFMVLVSDPGRSVAAIPHHDRIPAVFLNPPDIGGRYSALTYVGLLPASLLGLDLDELLASAQLMLAAATTREDPRDNGAVGLGLAIGALAASGRDKLTLVIDPEVAAFGTWLEQLIAESTGKRGVGIVPVDGEPLGAPDRYGRDRVFVRISLAGSAGPGGSAEIGDADELLRELAELGHPVIRIALADPMDLGGEFVRWEVATAIAGAVLGIDPFDQPDVEDAKRLTREVLETGGAGGREPDPTATGDGIAIHPDEALRGRPAGGSVAEELARHLARRDPTGYLSLQAFVAPTPARDAALGRIRTLLRDRTGCATTGGYGPRYLHSTGQLHKGGTPTGCFIQLTADHPVDRPIPGKPYGFGTLIDAQAAGDFAALERAGRPVVRVHLGGDPDRGLAALERALGDALDGAGAR